MVAEGLLLRIVAGDQDTEGIVEEGVAEQRTERGSDTAIVRVVVGRDEGARLGAKAIEGPRRLDVDGRTDGARRQGEVGRLVNIELPNVFRAQGGEVKGLAVARSNLPAFRQDLIELRAESTHGNSGRGACS